MSGKRNTSEEAGGAVKSAERVLDLFELLGHWGDALPHTAIAEALAIPKSSLTQLLKTLVQRGYVAYLPASKGYRLGPAFGHVTQRTQDARSLAEVAAPVLSAITEATRETCALNQLKGDMAEVVATVSGPQRLATHMHLGDLAPLYATSGGKSILAFLPAAMQAEYLGRVRFTAVTPKTLRSRTVLAKQLALVRQARVAYSFEEFTPGVVGIAVPILSEAEYPLGSLNVAMPAVRYAARTRDAVIAALRAGVARIERQVRRGAPAPAHSRRQ